MIFINTIENQLLILNKSCDMQCLSWIVLCGWLFTVVVYSLQDDFVHSMETVEAYPHSHAVVPGAFVYTPCNVTAVPIYFSKLTVHPGDRPVNISQNILLDAELYVAENIGGNIAYDLDVSVKINDEYEGLCDLLMGYCHGEDACRFLTKIPMCPTFLVDQGFNCSCPVQKNTYSIKFPVRLLDFMYFTITGAFNITMKLSTEGRQLMCANIKFCLVNCDS